MSGKRLHLQNRSSEFPTFPQWSSLTLQPPLFLQVPRTSGDAVQATWGLLWEWKEKLHSAGVVLRSTLDATQLITIKADLICTKDFPHTKETEALMWDS